MSLPQAVKLLTSILDVQGLKLDRAKEYSEFFFVIFLQFHQASIGT
jgi:hypothetical protein